MVTKTYEATQKILGRMTTGELDDAEAEVALRQAVTQIQTDAESTSTAEQVRADLVATEAQLRQASIALGLGDALEDARASNLVLFWNEAVQANRDGKYDVADVRRNDALKELARLESVIETEKISAPRRSGQGLNDRTPSSSAAGASDQTLVNRMATGATMTPSEMVRAGQAMDRGITPKIP